MSAASCDSRQLSDTNLCTVIADPAHPLDGYKQFSPDEKMGDPRAQIPTYVYLVAGHDAVAITGPSIPFTDHGLATHNASIAIENPTSVSASGYFVTVDDHLAYRVRIDDFEFEVALARVELCPTGTVLESRFVFPGITDLLGGGVAHDLTIDAIVDGATVASTSPVTVEVRP
ncbi:MAG TPA: hypothetical protein VN903_35350 [Polyangia bacterium]|nr:hypothetical protein [Polyangia bacterium]